MTTRQLTTCTVSIAELREVVAVAIGRHPDQRARIEKGATIVRLRTITPDPEYHGSFDVESASAPGTFYSVDHRVRVCQCPDQQRRGGTCGHLWALDLLRALARLQAHEPALAEAA